MPPKCPNCGTVITKENHDFKIIESPLKDRLITISECQECKTAWFSEGEYEDGFDREF